MMWHRRNIAAVAAYAGLTLAALPCSKPAFAQTSYVSPDGRNRFPAVTIFCPSGNGVMPCNFGGGTSAGGGNGTFSINLGGTAVSPSNRLPVSDPALDGLIAGGALNIGGVVSVSALPPLVLGAGASTVGAVSQAGTWTVNLAGGLPAGTNALGSVSISNLPATQAVSGTVGLLPGTMGAVTAAGTSGTTAQGVQGVANGVPLAVAGSVSQAGGWSVGVSSLPALPAGANTIGAVSIAGTPTFNCVGCGGAGGAAMQGAGSSGNAWWMQGLGSAGTPSGGVLSMQGVPGGAPLSVSGTLGLAAGSMGSVTAPGSSGSAAQAVQGVSGGVALPVSGSVSVANLPAVQPVSAAALPLPAGAAQDSSVQALKTALGTPMQQSGGTVAIASLPPLPAGSNTIGTVGLLSGSAGSVTAAGSGGSLAQAVQGIAGGVPQPVSGSVTVANLPATQPVSAATWPLPGGAATLAAQSAPLATVAPAAATATSSVLVGCQAATALPSFTAGQQGAVPCDSSGRLYVVTVPSANNVPGYLQAVTSGGASVYRAVNAASSTMAASVKSGSGMVYGYEACNSGTQAAYLRLFALATAPTVGTSTPMIAKLLPPGACQTTMTDLGLSFAGGIGVDVTAGSLGDADTVALAAANQVSLGVYYK